MSLTSAEYLSKFTENGGVLAKIKEKMPWAQELIIKVQHDNATPHTGKGNDHYLAVAGTDGGWNIDFFNNLHNHLT